MAFPDLKTAGPTDRLEREFTGSFILPDQVTHAAKAGAGVLRLAFPAKSAHEIDDKDDQQNHAQAAAANSGSAKVKAAATEHEKQNNDQE